MFQSVVEAVFHHANEQPDHLCIADDFSAVTYREFADRILISAEFLRRSGICAGDKIVIEAEQTHGYLALEMAVQLLGAIFVPVERNCAQHKIDEFIKRCEAKACITVSEYAYSASFCCTHSQIQALDAASGCYQFDSFPKCDAVSEILFSTGTTGKEKGIVLTHANNIALAENVIHGVEMEKDNIEMILSPMNHSHGLRRWYGNMVNGSSVVLLGSAMNMMQFMHNIRHYKVNSIDMVPSALSVVLRLSKNKLTEFADQLRYIQFGAAPMAEADKIKICSLLPKTRLYNFYGSTESGCIAIYNFNCPDSKKNCVGKPTYNARIFMVNDDREEICASVETPGLLACFGKMNMLGYWNDPDETEKALTNGSIYSNDVAYFDSDGDIILLGRKGDVINVGGNKVSPDEIEDAVKQIPGVVDCGVIAVEDPMKGNVPKLFVQLKDANSFDPVAIRDILSGKLEPYKIPVYIERIDRIPRSFNGKLLRKELALIK